MSLCFFTEIIKQIVKMQATLFVENRMRLLPVLSLEPLLITHYTLLQHLTETRKKCNLLSFFFVLLIIIDKECKII